MNQPERLLTPEEEEVDRRHSRTTRRASILATLTSTFAIVGVVGPAVLYISRPLLVGMLAEALAPTVNAQIKEQIAPVNEAFKVILRQQIDSLQEDVDRLEYERTIAGTQGAPPWTLDKVNELRDKSNKLIAAREALAAIINAER